MRAAKRGVEKFREAIISDFSKDVAGQGIKEPREVIQVREALSERRVVILSEAKGASMDEGRPMWAMPR